jgi:hypothetical protein
MSGFVEVYQREDHKIYVQSCSRVSGGPLVGNGWAGAIAADASDAEVGRLVMDGLSRTELDIPEVSREDVEKLLRPLLKLAAVRSFTLRGWNPIGRRRTGHRRHSYPNSNGKSRKAG